MDGERLKLEFIDGTQKKLPLTRCNTHELSRSPSLLDNSTSKNKLWRVIIALKLSNGIEKKRSKKMIEKARKRTDLSWRKLRG